MTMLMKRLAVLAVMVAVLGCPGDKRGDTAQIPVGAGAGTDSLGRDTSVSGRTGAAAGEVGRGTRGSNATPGTMDSAGKADLGSIRANLPAAAPDTFKLRKLPGVGRVSGSGAGLRSASVPVADAPVALLDAVQREQSATRFCYTEFGQKADPKLRGNVAMVVTVGSNGISDVHVGDSKWTGTAGRSVNRCLDEKAKQAWNLSPGAVKPGRYAVQLSFSGTQ